MRRRHRIASGLTLALVAVAGWRTVSDGRVSALETSECSSAGDPSAGVVDTTTDLRLVLNVPAYRLDVMLQGEPTRSIRVAVGQPKYRTPIGHFRIDYAVWNPWWRPPASEWARKERPKAPGWANPVGRVKLHVTGLVFLHGTPLDSSLGTAASHACVRMSNADAIDLATLVHAHAGPPMPPALLEELVADTSRSHALVLSRTVPLDITYTLAEVRDADLVLYADIYRYAGSRVPTAAEQATRALRTIRPDSATIDTARLRALVRSAWRATVRLPVESLFVKDTSSRDTPLARAR